MSYRNKRCCTPLEDVSHYMYPNISLYRYTYSNLYLYRYVSIYQTNTFASFTPLYCPSFFFSFRHFDRKAHGSLHCSRHSWPHPPQQDRPSKGFCYFFSIHAFSTWTNWFFLFGDNWIRCLRKNWNFHLDHLPQFKSAEPEWFVRLFSKWWLCKYMFFLIVFHVYVIKSVVDWSIAGLIK